MNTRTLICSILLAAAPWAALAQTTFTKITTGPIVNDGGNSFACAWGDYDNDGFLDLLVTNTDTPTTESSKNFLYHNKRDGTFTRITVGAIANDLGQWQGCAWADYDNDGFLDLFVDRWGIDWLYHNNENGGFTSVTKNLLGTDTEDGFTAAWADCNNDGRPDLFLAITSDPQTRRLYRNLGGGSFEQVTSGAIVTEGGLCFGSAWGDYDNDGFLDLFVANGNTDENNFLYHNHGDGSFTRMTSDLVGSIASDPAGFDQCAWGDYDNDGFIDLVGWSLASTLTVTNHAGTVVLPDETVSNFGPAFYRAVQRGQ